MTHILGQQNMSAASAPSGDAAGEGLAAGLSEGDGEADGLDPEYIYIYS